MRLLITGVPRSGKTTLANLIAKVTKTPIRHTDELVDLEWSAMSEEVARWLDWDPKPYESHSFIIEGVTIPRGLRKWRTIHGEDRPPPFDWFILLRNPRGAYTKQGQETMAKQVVGLSETMKAWIGERWIEL